jgi:outer membrane lipoprotein SlyB
MDRRTFLTSASAVGAAALAGCSSNETGNEDTNTTEEEERIQKNGEQYIFLDENETLRQLGL